MRVYLLRHGIAEDAGPRTPDSERQLTDKGRTKLGAVLRQARRGGVQPELVLSSPLVRAVQTAEMAREILEVESPVQTTPSLVPESHPVAVWNEIRELRKLEGLLLAGHEPLMSHLAAWLLDSPTLQIHMTKAALVCLELDNFGTGPHATLNWMLTPKVIDA